MAAKYMQLMLTPAVQKAQDEFFGRHQVIRSAPETDLFTDEEVEFIASRDSFYMGTVNEAGWPYIQHRGGPPGFVKVLGPNFIGFADFQGNRQLLTTGNLKVNDRVSLFMMDYASRNRLKILGNAQVLDARENHDLARQLAPEDLLPRTERLFLIRAISYDWNCPQYIPERFTIEQVKEVVKPLKDRIAELEAQVAELKGSGQG